MYGHSAAAPGGGPAAVGSSYGSAAEQYPRQPQQQHRHHSQHQRHLSSPRTMMAGASAQPSAGALVTGIPGAPYVEKENSPLRSPSPVKRGKQSSQQQPRDEQQPTGSLGILAAIGRGTFRQRPAEVVPDIDEEFDRLLNTLEVPESLRSKLLSMSKSVKESMVRGQTLIPTPRSRSGSMSAAMFSSSEAITPAISAGPSRSGSSSTIALPPRGASTKEVPEYFATHLKANDASRVDVARVRRLRVLLGSESPAWASEFIEHQGLAALCRRMQELIDMEWREEQHDDLLLHEILRCLSVLSKTDRGKVELAAQIPQPFAALVDLAFSEKKPGDLGTRKIIFDLVTNLFSMGIVPAESNRKGLVEVQTRRHLGRCTQKVCSTTPQERVRYRQGPVFPAPSGSSSNSAAGESADWTLSFVLALLSNPRTPESDAMLDFISASHTPRPFKTYLLEVSGVCRDYFWIFCHAQNRFWDLSSVNVDDIESPKVPGGATGSVEFEAMAYLTCHLRLLNVLGSILVERHAFAGLSDGTSAAYDFYNELFFSGMERILSVLRKSSQVYYQPTHLELARFFHLAARARFGVPPGLAVWQNRPLQLHA